MVADITTGAATILRQLRQKRNPQMQSQLSEIRDAVAEAIQNTSAEEVAKQMQGVTTNTLRNFVSAKHETSARKLEAIRTWFENHHSIGTKPQSASTAVRESAPDAYTAGVLAGQAMTVRRLLEHALREQDALILGLQRAGLDTAPAPSVTPPVSRAKLDATVRRQMAKDAEDARRQRGTG